MTVLQRSCQSCVASKRRCNLTAPQCARCSAKRITCRYVNEPGTAAGIGKEVIRCASMKKHRRPYAVTGEANNVSLVFSLSPASPRSHIYHPSWPEIVRTFDAATLSRLVINLRGLPLDFAHRKATSFLHCGLYGSRLPAPLQDIHGVCASLQSRQPQDHPLLKPGTLQLKITHLLRLAARASSYTELLAYVQAATIAQIICLLGGHASPEDDAERDKKSLWRLAHLLWEQAPAQLPSMLSPWRAWLLAESVRRTLLVCHILLGVHGVLTRGYAIQPLCVEALPFDMRTGLWDAESGDAWAAARAAYREPSLVSFRQFRGLRRPTADVSSFETLLLLSFKQTSWP